MSEKDFDAAWAAAHKHGASPRLTEKLARASEATHATEALEAYAQRVNQLVTLGDNHAYAEAAGLVDRMAGFARRRGTGGLHRRAQAALRPQAQFHEVAGLT
jgi:hypothetical protein